MSSRNWLFRALLTAAAICAALPARAVDFSAADPDPSPTMDRRLIAGYLDLQGGYSWFNSSPGEYEARHFDAAGALNVWVSSHASVQFDAWDEELQFIGDGSSYLRGVGGHFSWRDPSRYLVGGVASIGEAFGYDYANVAAEAQRYIGNLTLYGQAGYGWSFGDPSDQKMPYVQLTARYFLGPDFMVEGQAGYARFTDAGLHSADVVRYETSVERKLPGTPFAGYIAYQGTWNDPNAGATTLENAVLVGVKLIPFGTLLANDRTGATLEDQNPLFGRPYWRF